MPEAGSIATEELSRACGAIALGFAGTALGTFPILLYGSEEQKKKYLPDIAKGKKLAAFGLSESTAGSDARGVKTTAENIEVAMKGEIYESTIMYPGFLAKAEKDGIKDASDAFEDAGRAEAVHASLYKEALGNLRAWKGKNKEFYVCPFCGNVVKVVNFKTCPLCGEKKEKFMKVK